MLATYNIIKRVAMCDGYRSSVIMQSWAAKHMTVPSDRREEFGNSYSFWCQSDTT